MRRSLFDLYAEEEYRAPRIRPNIFARLAQFCFKNPWIVISFWIAVSIACAGYSIKNLKSVDSVILDFSQYSKPAIDMELFNQNFPNFYGLSKVTLASKNSENLKVARKELLNKLDERSDLFSTIVAPGFGSFYDANGLLYLPSEVVQASVNYALALRPLFGAIAEQPNTASLSTLINEVSASIELGRDPQGLDEFFSEAANATNALMKKAERPVNWKNVAGLDADPNPLVVQILIVPKPGKNAEANSYLESSTKQAAGPYEQSEGKISISVERGEDVQTTTPQKHEMQNRGPLIALAIVLTAALLFTSLGHLGLSAMVVLPGVVTLAISSALFVAALPQQAASLWYVILSLTFCAVYFSMRYACAALEAFSLARARTSAIMLAAQRQGFNLGAIAIAAAAPWLSWVALGEKPSITLSAIAIATILFGVLSSLCLVPAIAAIVSGPLRWSAVEWILPIYEQIFSTAFGRLARNIVAAALVLAAVFGVWATPSMFEQPPATKSEMHRPIHLIARKQSEIADILAKLKSVPEAQSVQWLNTFVPIDAESKIKIIKSLKDQFVAVAPQQAQDADTIRDQISALLESLQAIANSPVTRPELAVLAHDFRRSLEVFNNTATDQEFVQFEKRMFGAYNVLPEYAQELTDLKVPDMDALDPALRSIFRSEQGAYRLTVQPANNINIDSLAQKLADLGLPVVHPAVVRNTAAREVFQKSVLIAGLALLLGWTALVSLLRRADLILVSLVTSIIVACATIAVFTWYHEKSSCSVLLFLTLTLSHIFARLTSLLTEKHQAFDLTHEALLRTQSWMVPLLCAALALANFVVNASPASGSLPLFTILILLAGCATEFLARPLMQKL